MIKRIWTGIPWRISSNRKKWIKKIFKKKIFSKNFFKKLFQKNFKFFFKVFRKEFLRKFWNEYNGMRTENLLEKKHSWKKSSKRTVPERPRHRVINDGTRHGIPTVHIGITEEAGGVALVDHHVCQSDAKEFGKNSGRKTEGCFQEKNSFSHSECGLEDHMKKQTTRRLRSGRADRLQNLTNHYDFLVDDVGQLTVTQSYGKKT